jgi:hypothetical protein
VIGNASGTDHIVEQVCADSVYWKLICETLH